MPAITDAFASVYRDFNTDGLAASGVHEPLKSDIRGIGPVIEAALGNAGFAGVFDVFKTTRALLNADLNWAANAIALVSADPTDANNDLYIKVGASGTGSWTLTTTLHDAIRGIAYPYSSQAAASATAAHTSEVNAGNSATAAAGSAATAGSSMTAAHTSEVNAGNSATAAAGSATAAGNSATAAHTSEVNAGNSATAAAGSATAAGNSATAAHTSEANAGNSATAAAGSATAAGNSAATAASVVQLATLNAARDQLTKSVIAARANQDTKDPAQNWMRFVDWQYGATLTSATYDSTTDTFTIAAGGSIAITLPSTGANLSTPWVPSLDPLTRYLAVATTDDDASTLVCKLQANNPAPTTDVYTLPDFMPGVKMGSVTTLTTGKTGYRLLITNTGATSKTIFCPYAGTGYPIIERVAQKFRYRGRPIERRDYSFKPVGSRVDAAAREAAKTVWADSVAGSDSNNGTSFATPKQTLVPWGSVTNQTPLLPSGSRIGLLEGSTFLTPLVLAASTPGGMLDRVEVGRVSKGGRTGLPFFDQTTEPAANAWVNNNDGSWSYTFTQTGIGNNGAADLYYASVGVMIGVAATAAAKPMTSWRRMMEGSGVATYPGKYTTTPTTAGTVYLSVPTTYTVTVWPPDGLAPGTGAYRYKVVNSYTGLLWYNQPDSCVGWLSDCDFFGSSSGYGSVNGPTVLYAKNVVTRHGTTHNAVIGSGHLRNWMIWDRGNANSIGLTFYKPDPTGLNWSLEDILAFGTNGMNCLYAHNGGGGSYGTGLVRRACVYDPVAETVALPSVATIGGQATQTITFEDCYINNGNATGINISSESGGVRNVRRNILIGNAVPFTRNGGSGQCTIENNFIRTRSWSDSSGPGNRGSLFLNGSAVLSGTGNSVDVQHNTAHLRATSQVLNNDGSLGVYGSSRPNNNKYNIFVLEWLPGITAQNGILWTIDYNNPGDWNSDFNFIVLCGARPANSSGGGIINRTAGPPNVMDWDTYRSVTGQDAHSFFIDLRGDPLGAKLIWNDPDNYDYNIADTPYGAMLDRWMRTYDTGCPFTLHGLPRVPDPDRQYIEMRNH